MKVLESLQVQKANGTLVCTIMKVLVYALLVLSFILLLILAPRFTNGPDYTFLGFVFLMLALFFAGFRYVVIAACIYIEKNSKKE